MSATQRSPAISELAQSLLFAYVMQVKTILAAVDFSEESQVAVQQALDIARHVGASVTLLHVGAVPEKPVGVPASMHSTVAEYLRIVEDYLAEDRARLEALRERVAGQGVDVSHMVIDGLPDQGITQAAEELGADLIVTGTHGRTGFKRVVLGSVAERVVRTAKCAVLVARPKSSSAGGFQRILVATDFSEIAERALATAVDLAAHGGEIDVLHCWNLLPLSYPYYAPIQSASELAGSIRESIQAGTQKLGEELLSRHRRSGVSLRFFQVEAAAASGIHHWLDEHSYDLLVMGSHGRAGPARFILGSVAERTVRHAPCSVLVVHAARASATHAA